MTALAVYVIVASGRSERIVRTSADSVTMSFNGLSPVLSSGIRSDRMPIRRKAALTSSSPSGAAAPAVPDDGGADRVEGAVI